MRDLSRYEVLGGHDFSHLSFGSMGGFWSVHGNAPYDGRAASYTIPANDWDFFALKGTAVVGGKRIGLIEGEFGLFGIDLLENCEGTLSFGATAYNGNSIPRINTDLNGDSHILNIIRGNVNASVTLDPAKSRHGVDYSRDMIHNRNTATVAELSDFAYDVIDVKFAGKVALTVPEGVPFAGTEIASANFSGNKDYIRTEATFTLSTDANAEIIFYSDPNYANPMPSISGIELGFGETVRVYVSVKVNGITFYYVIAVTRPQITTPVIRRRVGLPQGFRTSPAAGEYYVNSGEEFIFYLPVDVVPEGLVPNVTTGRAIDTQGGVEVNLLDDGRYEIRIRSIYSNIVVGISFSVGNEEVPAENVWATGNKLYITSATDSEARIYNVHGVLVKIKPCIAGETSLTKLERGLYFVVMNEKTWKVIVE